MICGGALALLLLQAVPVAPPSPEPEAVLYPLGARREPDLFAPGEPLRLVDLRYRLRDEGGTAHAFAARLRVRDWGYLAFESEGERRGVALTTPRTVLRVVEEDGAWRAFAGYRAPWLLFETDVRRRAALEGGGWIAAGLGAGRLSSDVELVARVVGDTRPRPRGPALRDRFLRAASLGLLWQRGAGFEALAEAAHSRERTPGGLEFERDAWTLALAGAWRAAEFDSEVGFENDHGRFPRQAWRAAAGARVPLFGRLVAEARTTQRVEPGAERVAYEHAATLTYFARRVRLPRASETGRRGAELARRATALGYDERRVFLDAERREQRERLALSTHRDELRDAITALYRAQVEQRLVPLLGVEASSAHDVLDGVRSRRYGLFVGVPWPPAWPWTHDESAAPFLSLSLSRRRDTYAAGFVATTDAVALAVSLDREMSVAVRWRNPEPSPLDLVRGVARPRVFEVEYVYAFGQ